MGNAESSLSGDPAELTKIADSCCLRFQSSGKLKDINMAINHITVAISRTPDESPLMLQRLTLLSCSLWARFNRTGRRQDLDKSIELWRQITSLTPQRDRALPAKFASLSHCLNFRFQRSSKLEDLDDSIDAMIQAVSFLPQEHPNLPSNLHVLGSLFLLRFSSQRELEDLDKSIEYLGQAVALAPPGHPEISSWLPLLASLLNKSFDSLSERSDLDETIERIIQAVSAAPEGHPEMVLCLTNLGYYLGIRFQQLGNFNDLEKSIEYKTKAVSISAKGHPGLYICLSNLGSSLLSRFEYLGQPGDLHKAIEHQKRAFSLVLQGHPEILKQVSNLGELLRIRYQRFDEISDLDEAIMCMSQAVSATSQEHRDRPILLNILGISLCDRYVRFSEVADLDKAIDYSRQAVSLTLERDTYMPARLNNLSHSLELRLRRMGKIEDANVSIECMLQAITLTPPNHLELPALLDSAGSRFDTRFEHFHDTDDLHKAVEYMSQAVSLTPEKHPNLPRYLNNLCRALQRRFQRLGKLEDLETAIGHMNQARLHTPEGHPEMPWILHNLGHLYRDRSNLPGYQGGTEDIHQAAECFRKAAQCSVGGLLCRFTAAREWARICSQHNIESPLLAYGRVMELLAQLIWLGNNVRNRYTHIRNIGEVTTEAVAAAIKMKDYASALEWLEEGQSIVWKQMLQLRTSTDDLSDAAPALAIELKQVAHDLDSASSFVAAKEIVLSNTLSIEQVTQRQHRLADRWEQLIQKARLLPGFESFMRPRKAFEFMRCAQSGPVVVINAHETSCDALIIQPGCVDVAHIPLDFCYEKGLDARFLVERLADSRGLTTRTPVFEEPELEGAFANMLNVLWTDIVQPILDFLGYMHPPSTVDLPHITWCTTGPFSFLPLHAAGDHNTGSWVFDYVVSSYTPTLSTLLSPPLSTPFTGILAVGQHSTPGMPSLPGTTAELNRVREKSQGLSFTRLDGEKATPSTVMTGMKEHSWLHLACHASQNPVNPLQSSFYLHGGTLDLATITQKQLKNVDFAFLSACQTAAGDKALSNEAVHLAAGMLMAGYRSVIATMWSIYDEEAPLVAERVYEHLLEGGTPDSRRAAVAVHKATEHLRAKVGVEAFRKWVPYIHMGQ